MGMVKMYILLLLLPQALTRKITKLNISKGGHRLTNGAKDSQILVLSVTILVTVYMPVRNTMSGPFNKSVIG